MTIEEAFENCKRIVQTQQSVNPTDEGLKDLMDKLNALEYLLLRN